jgi:two-component system KDP operon response regulator KdpE
MTPEKTLLVIEDEVAILRFLRPSMEKAGWRVWEATTGRVGVEVAAAKKPDAILLDLGLPDREGLDVLKNLRQWSSAPILIISARGQEKDKIAGLDAGADDYLTKPFSVAELLARLRVSLRHRENRPEPTPIYECAGLKVDLVGRHVWIKKKEIHLTPQQYDVLAVLVRHAGRVVTHAQLLREAWGDDRVVTPESARIFVYQLRHKIEPDPVRPRYLKTEPAIGYRLTASDE